MQSMQSTQKRKVVMSIFRETHILLNEVKMNDVELMKPNSTTGEERVDILLQRIEKNQPLELEKGGDVVVDKKKSADFIKVLKSGDRTKIREFVKQGNKYPPIFVGKDGKQYQLTALKKAAYFGGGAGAAKATAESTAQQESTQAMVLALAIKLGRDLTLDDLTTENLVKAKAGYDVDSGVDKAVPFISDRKPSGWGNSLINTANILRKKLDLDGMVIHRGSSWVKSLEKKFNQVNKGADGKRVFQSKDKWNPSDIWAVKPGTEVLSKINDLAEFKAWLQKMYEEKKVYGISLKKAPKNTKLKSYNVDNDYDDLLDLTIKDLLVGKTNELFRSLGTHVIFEDVVSIKDILAEKNELDVRRFRVTDNVAGEIKGKYAAGGKIGFGPMNRLLRNTGLPELTHRKEIGKLLDKNLKQKARDQGKELDRKKYYHKITSKIISMASEVNSSAAKKAKTNLEEISNSMKFNEFASKYQAVELVAILKKASEEKRRDFIQKVIQYASSRDELSTVFTKVW